MRWLGLKLIRLKLRIKVFKCEHDWERLYTQPAYAVHGHHCFKCGKTEACSNGKIKDARQYLKR